MSDNFFDNDEIIDPWKKRDENDIESDETVNITNMDNNMVENHNDNKQEENSMKDNLENAGNIEKTKNEYEPGIFERNSKVGKDETELNGSYNFWAEQIAATSSGDMDSQSSIYRYKFTGENKNTYDNTYYIGSNENKADNNQPKKKSFGKKVVKYVLGAAVFGLVAGATFIGVNTLYYKLNPNAVPFTLHIGGTLSNNGIIINPPSDSKKQLSTTVVSNQSIEQKTEVTDVVEKTMPSIVTITTTYTQSYYDWFGQQYDQENEGGGSGIIVSKTDTELLIATNNHVVEGADPIKVKFIDGNEAEAIIKGTDAIADLAVISIDLEDIKPETLKAIQVATLGDSENVKVGQMAVAIGNALGYGQSTTVGYISAKDREVKVDDKTMVLLQTDAAINPGNSGGALLNIKGEVIGINTVKYASSEVEGMGFAIPISRAIPIIDELMSREILKDNEKGYLGIYLSDVTEEISSMYGWPVGVYVKETVEGGSAEKAGILPGDIITKVNDTEITAGTQLKEKVTSYRVGTEIDVTIMRVENGKFVEKVIKVTLGSNPSLQEDENSNDNGDANSNKSESNNSNRKKVPNR